MATVLPIFFVIAAGLCLSLVLLALWQSLRLVLGHERSSVRASEPRNQVRAALLREKQELLGTIRELRSEHELGKVSDADFSQLEQRYRARARDVLRELDAQLEPHRDHARALIETALGESAKPASNAPVTAPALHVCPKCNASNDVDAVFCKKCGARIAPEAAS